MLGDDFWSKYIKHIITPWNLSLIIFSPDFWSGKPKNHLLSGQTLGKNPRKT
jgi:hypothetical protein